MTDANGSRYRPGSPGSGQSIGPSQSSRGPSAAKGSGSNHTPANRPRLLKQPGSQPVGKPVGKPVSKLTSRKPDRPTDENPTRPRRSRRDRRRTPGTSAGLASAQSKGNAPTRLRAISAPPRSASSRTGSSTRPRRRSARRSLKTPLPLLYLGRLVVAGLGIAAIGGTLLTVLPSSSSSGSAARTESALAPPAESKAAFAIPLAQENAALKAQFEDLPNLYPGLTAKLFYVDVDTGDYVDLAGREAIAAASTIKLPILLAFFEEVDAGRINPNQTMTIQPDQLADGSGEMQVSAPGTQFTALEVATQMIVSSDNTATNMMVDLLGGSAALNSKFAAYGLEKTRLNGPLPDLDGTNTTSARDLAQTLLLVTQDETLTLRSRDRVLNILQRTYNKSLLAAGLEEKEALTYNKTGDIASVLGDAALVDLSNGKRYIVAVLVERPTNDGRAVELIRRISGRIYQVADQAVQPAVAPANDPSSTGEEDVAPTLEPEAIEESQSLEAPYEEPYVDENL
ncbi:hypothetical protein BH23CYA1_BH23CYA1_05320 [soil metagenome]